MDENLKKCVGDLKAVIILGGEVVPVENKELSKLPFRSTRGSEENQFGSIPAFERVLAGATIWKMNPNIVLIPSGGKSTTGTYTGEVPFVADVMKSELIEEGVPEKNIITETKSSVTADALIHCAEIMKELGVKSEEIGIISNYWHFGRVLSIMLMSEKEKLFPIVIGKTKFISAERILMNEDKEKWGKYFIELENTLGMKNTLEAEAKGNGQMLSGHQPKWPNPFRGFEDPLE